MEKEKKKSNRLENLYRRGNSYVADFYFRGQRYTENLGPVNRTVAKEIRDKRKNDVAAGEIVDGAGLQCSAPTLTPTTSATLVLVVNVGSAVTGTITNTVLISSSTPDPLPSNNAFAATNPDLNRRFIEASLGGHCRARMAPSSLPDSA